MKIKEFFQRLNSNLGDVAIKLNKKENIKKENQLEENEDHDQDDTIFFMKAKELNNIDRKKAFDERWMKNIVDTNEKIERGEFTMEDVEKFLHDFYFSFTHYGVGTYKKSRDILLQKIRPQIAEYFGVSESEIAYSNYYPNIDEKECPYKVVMGDCAFYNSNLKDLGELKFIGGDANFYNSKITTLGKLEKIAGNVERTLPCDIDLGNLNEIGGSIDFSKTNIKTLGKLKKIGGSARFANCGIEDLGELSEIGGVADFNFVGNRKASKLKSLGKLKSVGDFLDVSYSNIEDLGNLEFVGGSLHLSNCKVKTLGKLKKIGRDLNIENSYVENIGDLKFIGRDALMRGAKVKCLNNLNYIGGSADFRFSNIVDFGSLRKIVGSLKINEWQVLASDYELKYEVLINEIKHVVNANKLHSVGEVCLYDRSVDDFKKIAFSTLKEFLKHNNHIYQKLQDKKRQKYLTK